MISISIFSELTVPLEAFKLLPLIRHNKYLPVNSSIFGLFIDSKKCLLIFKEITHKIFYVVYINKKIIILLIIY